MSIPDTIVDDVNTNYIKEWDNLYIYKYIYIYLLNFASSLYRDNFMCNIFQPKP